MFCSAVYNLVLEKIMTKNKLKSVWLWNFKLKYVLRESPPPFKVSRTRCGFWAFLLVSTHLIILDLLDYDPIISRIEFWWFSVFLETFFEVWKRRKKIIIDWPDVGCCRDCVFSIFVFLCICALSLSFIFYKGFLLLTSHLQPEQEERARADDDH